MYHCSMKSFRYVLVTLLWAVASVCWSAENDNARYDFATASLSRWAIVGPGDWKIEAGKLHQTHPPYVETAAAAPHVFHEGVVSFDASVPVSAPGSPRQHGIGFVRFVDGRNYWWVRFGDYGGIALKGRVNNESVHVHLGTCTLEKGRVYPIRFALRDGQALVSFDGKLQFVLADPLGDRPGRVGCYTLANAVFENLVIRPGRVTRSQLEDFVAADSQHGAAHPTPTFVTELPEEGNFMQDFSSPSDVRWWNAGAVGRGGERQYVHVRDGGLWIGRDRPEDVRIMSAIRIGEGTVSARVRLSGDGEPHHHWFGFVVPAGSVCIGRENRCRIYDGRRAVSPPFGKFKIESGQDYDVRIEVSEGRIAIVVDGDEIGAVKHENAGRVGQVGLLANVMTRFDDFRIDPCVPYDTAPAATVSGSPRMQVIQVLYRPDDTDGIEAYPIHGTVSVFLRNEGDGPARLEELFLDDAPLHAGQSPLHVVWSRQRPWEIAPGEIGEVQVRLRSLPPKQIVAMFTGSTEAARSGIRLRHVNGNMASAGVAYRSTLPPVQINFIGFSDDLRALYVYVQNNAAVYHDVPGKRTYHIDSVEVNGRDVTARSRIPQRVISDDVLPIVVLIDEPLEEGTDVFVRVGTTEGEIAPHGVRAFPSRLLLQMTQVSWPTRPDMMEDIRNHGFNAVHFSTKRPEWGASALEQGLWHGIYGGSFLGDVMRYDHPEHGITVGLWLDEVDKASPEYNFGALDWMETFLRVQGRRAPFHYNGLVRARTSGAPNYSVLTDGICRAQQVKDLDEAETGRAGALRYMEHRQVRRPSLPYYRDAEIPVPFSPLTREVLDPAPSRRRCISPREERFLQYSNFLQGAKGAYHWAYSCYPKAGFYEIHSPVLRLGNGGGVVPVVYDYAVPEHVRRMIMATWDEIGRINTEIASVGPLLARGDVCYRARVVRASPSRGREDDSSVEVSATLVGDDSIVLIVLNQNFTYRPKSSQGPSRFDPVDVTVGVKVPKWLQVKSVLRIAADEVTELRPNRQGDELFLDFPALDVSELVLVTSNASVAARTRERHAEQRARFAAIRRDDFTQIAWSEMYHAPVTYRWHESDPYVSLSDLRPKQVRPDAAALRRNEGAGGGNISVLRIEPAGGRMPEYQRRVTFEKALVLEPGGSVGFDLDGGYTYFDCILAVDPEIDGGLKVKVELDGKTAFDRTFSARAPAARVRLKLDGVRKLFVMTGADPNSSAPLVVGHPRLLPVGKQDEATDLGVY